MARIRTCLRWRKCKITTRACQLIFVVGLCLALVLRAKYLQSTERFQMVLNALSMQGETSVRPPLVTQVFSSSHRDLVQHRKGGASPEVLSNDKLDLAEQQLRDMQNKIQPGTFAIESPANPSADTEVHFRYRDLAAIQAERHERIRRVCHVVKEAARKLASTGQSRATTKNATGGGHAVYHEGWYTSRFLYRHVEVHSQQHVLFCPVLKVGSTFFRRLFYSLARGLRVSSPFEISVEKALGSKRDNLANLLRDSQTGQYQRVDDFLNGTAKVMFTRDPYSKLLSGYVDKLWAPNPYFWSHVGRAIVRQFRPGASLHSLTCGHDVTFPEFIQYVLANSATRDAHFAPSYDQCKPCDVHYDLVGTMETFPQDVSLLVAQLGFNLSKSTLTQWSRETDYDAIDDSIRPPFGWKSGILKCMSWQQATERIWRKLQIRGVLDRNQDLPPDSFAAAAPTTASGSGSQSHHSSASASGSGPQSHSSSSSSAFIKLVSDSWERFRSNAGAQSKSNQKKEAVSSAYSLVPREDLQQLREFFLLDLDLFGYDSRPAYVFEAKKTWDVFEINS